MYRSIISVTAAAETNVRTVVVNANGAVTGIVDDSGYRASYASGEEMDVVASGPCLLAAVAQVYTTAWGDGTAAVGDILSRYSDGSIRVNDPEAKYYEIIGKVKGISNTNVYEVLVGIC